MLTTDLRSLVDRLERIDRAVDLACLSLERHDSPEIVDALADTCGEALRLGHELTLRVWYDEPWNELDTLHQIWVGIHATVSRITAIGVDARDGLIVAEALRYGMATLCIRTAALDAAQLQVLAAPGDATSISSAADAIDQLESAADTLFIAAVAADLVEPPSAGAEVTRLDAAHAVLTSTAARAARERASVRSRQS